MSNIDDYYKNINKIYSSISYLKFAELQNQIVNAYKPIFDMTSEIQNQYKAITIPIQKMVEQMTSAINPDFLKPFTDENLQQQLHAMQKSLSSISSSIGEMNIHSNYVSVPESLIPDDFLYEEVTDDSDDNSDEVEQAAVPVRRLSFSDTLTIIQMLFGLLAWIISFIQTNQSALQEQRDHVEQIAVETEANRIQEEQNQILQSQVDVLERQTEYLKAIYNKVVEAGSVSLELDSVFLDTDSLAPSADYPASCVESSRPIKDDGPDDSDTLHKAD